MVIGARKETLGSGLSSCSPFDDSPREINGGHQPRMTATAVMLQRCPVLSASCFMLFQRASLAGDIHPRTELDTNHSSIHLPASDSGHVPEKVVAMFCSLPA